MITIFCLLMIIESIILILLVANYPKVCNYQRRLNEEETERKAVNVILQAYLDGLEKGLSLSRQADYDLFDDIDNNDENEGE